MRKYLPAVRAVIGVLAAYLSVQSAVWIMLRAGGNYFPAVREFAASPVSESFLVDVLAAAVLFAMWRRDGRRGIRPPDRSSSVPVGYYLLGIGFMIGLGLLMAALIFGTGLGSADEAYREVSTRFDEAPRLIAFLLPVAAAPVAEELLFRGLIFRRIRYYLGNVPAAFVSSAMFGLVHGNLTQGISAFCSGFLLCFFGVRTEAVSVCIAMHMAQNLFGVISNDDLGSAAVLTAAFLWPLLAAAGGILLRMDRRRRAPEGGEGNI